jgi:hypothetical protein
VSGGFQNIDPPPPLHPVSVYPPPPPILPIVFFGVGLHMYIEYRAVSGVFQHIDPPHPLSTQRVCPPPAPKAGGGVHTRREVRGWGVNILEDARHWIGLLQYNPSTVLVLSMGLDSLRLGRLHNLSWAWKFSNFTSILKRKCWNILDKD